MLEKIPLREQAGRDSFGRYRAQVRSAALACLSILEGEDVDLVYCDLYDDFVVRKVKGNSFSYLFYQVKTNSKKNHNWTISDLFGINTRKDLSKTELKLIKDSFIGKLLLHTIYLEDECELVVFQTNIHVHDNIDEIVEDIISNEFNNQYTRFIVNRFNECFGRSYDDDEIKKRLSKLKFECDVEYLKNDLSNFDSHARDLIYQFSEVDLQRSEIKEILLKLLDLVERKSSGVIKDITSDTIKKFAGICIDDLLSILSISPKAYSILLNGGDGRAIKSVSIIQRILSSAGGREEIIEYCSRCKADWDEWVRKNRHSLHDLQFNSIIQSVYALPDKIVSVGSVVQLSQFEQPIRILLEDFANRDIKYDLSENLILGGVISEIVRRSA